MAPKFTSLADLLPELHTSVKLIILCMSNGHLNFYMIPWSYPQKTCSTHSLPHFNCSHFCSPNSLDLSSTSLSHSTSNPSRNHFGYTLETYPESNQFSTRLRLQGGLDCQCFLSGNCSSSLPILLSKATGTVCLRALVPAAPSACEHLSPDAWPTPSPPLCF